MVFLINSSILLICIGICILFLYLKRSSALDNKTALYYLVVYIFHFLGKMVLDDIFTLTRRIDNVSRCKKILLLIVTPGVNVEAKCYKYLHL